MGKSLSQHCKSRCINRLWSSPKILSPKYSGCSHEHFQACNLWLIQLSHAAIFSWPVSGVYLSKPCRHVGDFCFGVFHAPLWQSNPTCYAQMEALSFDERFSQGEKRSTQSRSAAIHPHSEALRADALGCKMWWAELSLQKRIYPSLLKLLGAYLKGGFGLFRLQVIEIDCWATREI